MKTKINPIVATSMMIILLNLLAVASSFIIPHAPSSEYFLAVMLIIAYVTPIAALLLFGILLRIDRKWYYANKTSALTFICIFLAWLLIALPGIISRIIVIFRALF